MTMSCSAIDDAELEAPDTRQVILATAQEAFIAHGFHATRMDIVAQRAGCSKKTIYKFFGSKEALFAELLGRMRAEVVGLTVDEGAPVDEALRGFLHSMAKIVLRDTSVALTRIVMSEAGLNRSWLKWPSEDRSIKPRLALEAYLNDLQERGGYEFGPPSDAARMLVGMAIGAFHHETLVGVLTEIPDAELEGRIGRAVRIFLRGARREAADLNA